ncbi:MAG TPA: isocitrate/isopropylmalate dehydrogenase family protein [Candidatus Paceibacterota bacterium]|nr:isocitrate/isopropylmalate dehydrogenase family protein [Verrucomicrobiota bacterium]HOX02722.1 isocitrate/isopropylmalate dehydrogenase family protein [Verrucomicrobiota bacterium]HRZ45394.1 isocitrate/isopropylmalate dehydrogenase family protein [Candidatus Paceibacterota bacterium]HRZ94594.1 isocitrate/isopropylmalate dehydrogenase family protein [Candidatus Paceibacterota bacterium]
MPTPPFDTPVAAPPKTWKIAVLPGDGIGLEVTREAVKVLQALAARRPEISFEFAEHAVGAEVFRLTGNPLPDPVFEACRSADAILLGAMGLPNIRWPDGRELTPQIDLRERLDLYCGLRPIRLLDPADSPLKNGSARPIDLLIVRENTEGLFSSRQTRFDPGAASVSDQMRITRHGSERIFHAAFAQARQRRRKVTLVDKANVLPSMVFFRQVFQQVARQYPDLDTECVYVDAAALYLVQHPERFDVLVTENMFGDILSDLAAGLVGGMGMAPSADIGDRAAVFQPAHGTAPDIAGRGIANPVAAILSAAMMLDWLGSPETRQGAERIRQAVTRVLAQPQNRTPDLGGAISTSQMGDLIVSQL